MRCAQITLTLLAAYGAYTMSDELLGLSGVLACVAQRGQALSTGTVKAVMSMLPLMES